jgi:transposase
MITNEVYVEIEILRKHSMSLRKIAKEVGGAVNTVRSPSGMDTHDGVIARNCGTRI